MNKTLLKGITASVVVAALTACTDGIGTGFGDGNGKIALTTDVDATIVTARNSRAGLESVSTSDLAVRLTSADGSYSRTWNSVADFPLDESFNTGAYTIEAFYGDELAEGFDAPRLYGSQEITVQENQTTTVNLTARVANSLVTVSYTDAFKDYMTNYSAEVHRTGGEYIKYPADETRPVFVNPGEVEVLVEFTKPNNIGGKLAAASFSAKAGTRYNVTVDLNESGSGSAQLVISFDENLEEVTETIDISDEVLLAAAPEITAEGFTPGEDLEFVIGHKIDPAVKFNILARGGLKGATLTTRSASLTAQGWPAEIDLMDGDAATIQKMRDLGLTARGIFGVPDKMAVIDLTAVISHITYLTGSDNRTEFILMARDAAGKVSQPVTLSLVATPVSLSLADGILYTGSTDLQFTLNYNGGNPAENVKVEYYHEGQGVWGPLNVTYSEATRARGSYIGHATTPDKVSDVRMRASTAGLPAVEMTVVRTPMVVPSGETNAFAKRAYIPVTIGKQDSDAELLGRMMANATVMLSTDGTNFTAATATPDAATKTFAVTGLKPATTYTAKIKNGSDDTAAEPFTFTTEAATNLDNADMEAWEVTASESNWQRWAVSGWATYNNMTTMTTGLRHNTAYVSRSGTAQSTDKHSGSYAAELRTIGWGAGNSAVGSISGSNPKYIHKGMLYLGGSPSQQDQLEAQATKGISFASRPSALKFWYKYSPKNGADYGGALIWVKDASGNVIAEGRLSNLNAREYTQVSIPLSYTATSAKCATIYVEFVSSDHPNWNTRSKDWFTVPGFGNMSDGKFQGSSMFIDDIELIYE